MSSVVSARGMVSPKVRGLALPSFSTNTLSHAHAGDSGSIMDQELTSVVDFHPDVTCIFIDLPEFDHSTYVSLLLPPFSHVSWLTCWGFPLGFGLAWRWRESCGQGLKNSFSFHAVNSMCCVGFVGWDCWLSLEAFVGRRA